MRDECVNAVVAAGLSMGRKITQTDLRGIEDKIREQRKELAKKDQAAFIGMSEAEKLQKSAEMAVKQIAHEAAVKKMRVEKQIAADAGFDLAIGQALGRGESLVGAIKQFAFVDYSGSNIGQSIESRAQGRARYWISQLNELWDMQHQGFLGNIFTDKKMEADFWREMYGQRTGNELAAKAAEGVHRVNDAVLRDMNDAGFDIPKLADYRSPQKLSFYQVWRESKNGGMDKVISDFLPHLNREKYVNLDGSLMNDTQLSDFMRKALNTIMTDGANKAPGEGGLGMTANHFKAHRQLHFKNAESFMYIMGKYSESNPIDMIHSHFESMARDLTLVQKWGPNSVHSINTKMARMIDAAEPRDKIELMKLQDAMLKYAGVGTGVANPGVARFFSEVRAAMSAILLGSNTITQMSDQATLSATARALGMSQFDTFKNQAKYITSSEYRSVLRSVGAGLDSASNTLARFADSASGGTLRKLSTAQMYLNGSNFMTNAVRGSFMHTMSEHLGSMVQRYGKVADLMEGDRKKWADHGVTEEMWAIWKMAELDKRGGSDGALTAEAIYRVPLDRIAAAMPGMVAEVKARGAEIVQRLDAQNAKEADWVAGRTKKLEDYRAKIQKMMDEYVQTRESRSAEFGQNNLRRAVEMLARLEKAEADAAIVDARVKATNAGRADRFADEVKRGVEWYGRRRSEIGERLGAARHSAKLQEAGASRAYVKLSEQMIAKKNELFGHERTEDGLQVIGTVTKAFKELESYIAKMDDRISRSTKKDGAPKAGKEGTIERAEGFKESAKVEFEAIKQRADSAIAELKSKAQGGQDEIRAAIAAIEAKKARAEAEADIAAYLETEKSADKIQALVDTLEFRFNQGGDRLMSEGERLGYRKAKTDAMLSEIAKREEAMAKKQGKEIFAKASEFEKRIDARMKDFDALEAMVSERAAKREAVIKEWTDGIGKHIDAAATKARDDAAMSLMSMMVAESHMASVQMSFLSSQDFAGTRGEIRGELGALFLQFKSFPWAYFKQHLLERGSKNGAGYVLNLMFLSTVTGAIALWLNDMASGRDPREAKSPKFVAQAFVKGGGAGILGDLMNIDTDRADLIGQVSGPGLTWLSKAARVGGSAVGTVSAAVTGDNLEGEAKKFGKDTANLVRSSVPLGNLWYGKAVLNNYLLRDIYEFMNPGYMDRMRSAAQKNYSAGVWTEEKRAPNIANIWGENP